MSWTIRRISTDDWEDVRDIRLRALKDAPDAFGATYDEAIGFDESRWRERAGEGRTFLGYDGDGPPVGMAASYWNEDVLELVAMWVAPEARGSGVAVELVDAVAEQAKGDGAADVHLWVTETNPAARKLYERIGFTYTGEREPMWNRDSLTVLGMTRPVNAR